MSKKRSSAGSSAGNMGSNGGILGSGIFGSIGTGVVCQAEDSSAYCTLVKFVNVIIMAITIIAVFYLIYAFATGKSIMSGGGFRSGRSFANK